MDRFDPFVKYADVYGDIINWEKDPMNKPQNQNKYFFSDGKTYYEQICKMLRLMSVFKEAFNQIYSNEDEISEAWENFVNNLSASVVEGSEPDVTLTWTDDSVNFEFTMVPGVPGEQGVGITSISFNSDYTMTITLSDGNTYTSMSLKGETGPQGPQGETGSGLQILDVYATLADLQSAHPTGQPGDAYQVGSAGNYTLYIWSSSQSAWVPAGSLGTVSPSLSNPLMDGTASAGSQNLYSRGDHVHPTDTSRASQEELDALIKTSQALIDQSFTYRESLAIQDGLARIDKIKGNTLVWNQISVVPFTEVKSGVTFTRSDDRTALQMSGTSTSTIYKPFSEMAMTTVGHVYYVDKGADSTLFQLYNDNGGISTETNNRRAIGRATAQKSWYFRIPNGTTIDVTAKPMIIDLTQMGLDITDPSDFTSLFPLPYYDFNQGSLLSFMGNGIKTVGKNLFDGIYNNLAFGNTVVQDPTFRGYTLNVSALKGKQITVSRADTTSNNRFRASFFSVEPQDLTPYERELTDGEIFYTYDSQLSFTLTVPNWANYLLLYISNNGTVANDLMIEIGSTVSDYEPYTSSTTSLPISTYFPTGMKSAGDVYDELTESKAITRIGSVDLGSLTWRLGVYNEMYTNITSMKNGVANVKPNILCPKYPTIAFADRSQYSTPVITVVDDQNMIQIRNTGATDVDAFKQSLSGVYLYYELATPTETAVDLDIDFMAYEDGTEQLLPVNGSVPSTSPVIADMTYLSIDDAMEYIIEKLANVPQNTQQILESLEDDVSDLQTDVGNLKTDVSSLQTSVGNINTNIGQISSTVAGHTASISDIQSDITDLNTDLGDLSDTVTDHTSRIGTLESGLSATNGNVQNLETSVSDLDDTVTAQGATVTALDSIIQDISNNPVISSLGSHELGFVAAYVSATLAANTGTKVTIPKPTIFPNNYTPLFIVGMSTGSYNVSICDIPYTFGNRDSVNCRVWNHGAQQTTQITVYILCMRQRQSQ